MSEKMKWSVELAEFSKISPAACIKVTGVTEDGRTCSRVIVVHDPSFPNDATDVVADWSE